MDDFGKVLFKFNTLRYYMDENPNESNDKNLNERDCMGCLCNVTLHKFVECKPIYPAINVPFLKRDAALLVSTGQNDFPRMRCYLGKKRDDDNFFIAFVNNIHHMFCPSIFNVHDLIIIKLNTNVGFTKTDETEDGLQLFKTTLFKMKKETSDKRGEYVRIDFNNINLISGICLIKPERFMCHSCAQFCAQIII